MRVSSRLLLVALLALVAGGAGESRRAVEGGAKPVPGLPMKLGSPDFAQGGFIPARFTCKGGDVSPALQWTSPPGNTQAFALIVEDPDAPGGTWTHWLLYNLPAAARALPQGVPQTGEISGGGRQGANDFGLIGYGGPCPPPGKPHRYFFRLYALNAPLALDAGASKEQVHAALQGRVVAETELMGRFKR